MHARARNRFVEVHQVFAFAKRIQEHRHCADIEGVRTYPHQVIENASNFVKHDANIFGTLGDIQLE